MNVLITAIGILGMLDLHCTLRWICVDPNLEANPIMRKLWTISPQLFIWAKIALTIMFCIIAYKLQSNGLMRRLIWLPFCMYVIVNILHLIILI